jgi:thiamine pyrophosphate-dependent acetolactate synthase large subunit-like protein
MSESNSNNSKTSRRNFLAGPVAAGALAASRLAPAAMMAEVGVNTITIPKEVSGRLSETPKALSFEGRGMTGAEVFAKLCKEEELAAMFCCPGNYTVINAIAATGIPTYGGRCEGAMCAAADGFSRVTGEATACSGTEGPGFTRMIMNIAAANAARTPLLVLASNMTIAADDREYFIQAAYQQPTTTGMKKYGKRLIAPDRVHEYGAYAFRNMKSGVPGVVHLDFPAEVARARFTSTKQDGAMEAAKLTDFYNKDRYRTESRAYPSPKDVQAAADMITKAERPVIVAGHGVFHHKAWDVLQEMVNRHEIAVVTSGPMRGHFPDDHKLSAALSYPALMSADLVVFIGQYSMPSPSEYGFNTDVKSIRVHPVPEDMGRNWPIDLGIVSDERAFLEALNDKLGAKKREAWVAEIAAQRDKFEKDIDDIYAKGLKASTDTGLLHPAVIAKETCDFLYKGTIDKKQTVLGWGGWTIGNQTGRWLRAYRPGQVVNCAFQYGAIGPDLAMTIGAGAAVQQGVGPQKPYKGAPVFVITSDAGAAHSLFEMDTAAKYKIPVVALIYNNNSWGMWPFAQGSPRSMHMYLFQENLRYDQMAEGLGARGEYVMTPQQLRVALKRSYDIAAKQGISTVINCQAKKEFTQGVRLAPEPSVGAIMH